VYRKWRADLGCQDGKKERKTYAERNKRLKSERKFSRTVNVGPVKTKLIRKGEEGIKVKSLFQLGCRLLV
jgi:hypothetical protein